MADQDSILEKVRALLAKAESTEFEAERETFIAGAQRLMAKYAIDEAMLAASGKKNADDVVETRLVKFGNKMGGPQTRTLCFVVAINCRCKAIHLRNGVVGTETMMLVGYRSDLDFAEMLFTSLLMQAVRAEPVAWATAIGQSTGARAPFRRSFIEAFAIKVNARLKAMTEEVVAEDGRTGVALALRDRDADVVDKFNLLFPKRSKGSVGRSHNAAGYGAGHQAGSKADLSGGRGSVGGNQKQLT